MTNAKKNSAFLIISIFLIAMCLRGPITGVGPLVTTLQELLGLSGTVAGLLTTLPLITFAVISFLTAPLARKLGIGKLMFFSLIVLFIGLAIRSFCGTAGLFIGTVILACGIGCNNVLLPVVIKSKFPSHIGTLTGVYTTLMAGFASISSGTSVPLTNAFGSAFGSAFGWRIALCIWLILVVFAFFFWLPYMNQNFDDSNDAQSPDMSGARRRSVACSSISWFITLFMGFQSMVFYFTVSWFATILQSYGFSPAQSGLYNMLMMLCGLPGSFIMPIVASRTKHQSFWGALIGFLYALGMISLLFAYNPFGLVVTIITNGFGSGAAIAFCMVLIGLHTKDSRDASSLSALSQGIGYVFAAVAPVLMGTIFDATGSWTLPLIIMTVIGIACTVCGWLSGLNRMVDTNSI